MRLEGKTAIVTGGSSGIGRAIARMFAREGARIVVADLTEDVVESGEPTCALIAAEGGTGIFQRTDISRGSEVEALVDAAAEQFGRVDILVNNAAIHAPARLVETSESDWDRVMDVNLKGAYLCARAAVRQMMRQTPHGEARGRIVNISSQHGMIAAPEDFAYGVSKAGIVYMTRQIAADYAQDGIICNAVAPGKVITGKPGRANDPHWIDYSNLRTPMPRLGTPDDVARAALFLASDEASYITGHNLLVDGGWMAA